MKSLLRGQQGWRVSHRVGRRERAIVFRIFDLFVGGENPEPTRGKAHGWSSSLSSATIRLRSAWLQILQTAVAACLAWFLAVLILGLERPTFAPIAAVISLGLAVDERGRRTLELTLGVAFGVVLADLLVSVVGVGAVQA